MDIVQHLKIESNLVADVVEESQCISDVRLWLEHATGVGVVLVGVEFSYAVGNPARAGERLRRGGAFAFGDAVGEVSLGESLARAVVGGKTGRFHLNADVVEALLDEAVDLVFDSDQVGARGVDVYASGFTGLATQQIINRHVGHLAFNVPERLIDTAESVVQNRAIAPVRGDVR